MFWRGLGSWRGRDIRGEGGRWNGGEFGRKIQIKGGRLGMMDSSLMARLSNRLGLDVFGLDLSIFDTSFILNQFIFLDLSSSQALTVCPSI